MKQLNLLINKAIPNKKTFYTVTFILILGLISGSIFLTVISQNDKKIIVETIKEFMNNVNTNNINNVQALKNCLINNYTFILLIWIFGLSVIGIIFNIALIYIKGFIIGFTVSSLLYTYGIKGILSSIIFLVPTQIINILVIIILSVYSIMLTKNIFKLVIGNKNINMKKNIKIYSFILLIICIITLCSSVLETFLTPVLYKLIIKLFI